MGLRPLELVVDRSAAGERLDAFLAPSVGSRARAQRLVAAGRVQVDGRPARKGQRLAGGERIAVDDESERGSEPPAAPPPTAPGIVYFDDALVVVDKPPGLVVHPARGHREGTLAQLLQGIAGGGEPQRAGIVHRLDRDTSGLMVVARTETAHRRLREALAERAIEREYNALVEGRPPARSGTIEAPIGRDRRDPMRMSLDSDRPRAAVTHFERERTLPSSTLLRVSLETGRTHQIRVHMQAIGHPVCGDPTYGHAELYGLHRQFLHAGRLAFEHPLSGERLELRSPLPEDLRVALAIAAGSG